MVASTDPVEACKGVDVAVMVGGFPRKGGMERKDVMAKNVSIYKSQADALEKGAKPDVKVMVPCYIFALLLYSGFACLLNLPEIVSRSCSPAACFCC